MKFNIGNTVKVITHHYGRDQFEKIGVIVQTNNPTPLNIRVKFDGTRYNVYHEGDLELYNQPPLLQPDFTLDEISAAQEIIDQMG